MKVEVQFTHADGTVEELDIPTLQSRKLHNFRGWFCSIGSNTLYIDFDGGVWRGSCEQGKPLGHIGSGWAQPTQPIKCDKIWCNCGADIKQPKTDGRNIVRPIPPDEYFVIWNLSRFCNFDCSYCPSNVHNHTDMHKDIALLKHTVDNIDVHFGGVTGIQYGIAGGEPIVYPHIIELCEYITAKGHRANIQTNGSRGERFWKALVPHTNSITISVHLEFMNMPRLLRNIETIINEGGNLEVKVMASNVDKAKQVLAQLMPYKERMKLAVMPMWTRGDPGVLRVPVEYDDYTIFGYYS